MLALHFSDPKRCRLWVITSKPVLQMFGLLSQAYQQESWGWGWAWCPGKAAESDWESAGVAELFSCSCCTQPFLKGRAGTLGCISLPAVLLNTILHANAYGLNTLKLILSRRCTLPCLLQASVRLMLQLIPKHEWGGKTVVEIQGKKKARAALTAFMSSPKVGMNIHGLGQARVSMSFAHSSLEWG